MISHLKCFFFVYFRHDSDIPVPYGRTVLKSQQVNDDQETLENIEKIVLNKTKLAAILISNGGSRNQRTEILEYLKNLMPLDVWVR